MTIATKTRITTRNDIELILANSSNVAKLERVPIYPSEIADAIRKPKFCEPVRDPNAAGAEAKFDCGCFVKVEMRIDGERQTIREIGYRTNGCGYMIAAAESAGASLSGNSLLELQGEIVVPTAGRPGCTDAPIRAIRNALADHRSRLIEEFSGEKALICTCFGVSADTVEQYVASQSAQSVTDVSAALRVGSGCGSCRMLIQEIIDANG